MPSPFSRVPLRRVLRAGWVATVLLASVPALAGQFTIAKVGLEGSAERPADYLVLTNPGAEPVSVQASPFAWAGPRENDGLTATQEVIVSPPLTTIAPGASQVIRVYYRGAPLASERAFRVMLREVPAATPSRGVQVTLALNVPFFVRGSEPAAPDLRYRLRQQPPALLVRNDGKAYEQLAQMKVLGADGDDLLVAGSPGYVLPGVEREFPLKRVPPDGVRVDALGVRGGKRVQVEVGIAADAR